MLANGWHIQSCTANYAATVFYSWDCSQSETQAESFNQKEGWFEGPGGFESSQSGAGGQPQCFNQQPETAPIGRSVEVLGHFLNFYFVYLLPLTFFFICSAVATVHPVNSRKQNIGQ